MKHYFKWSTHIIVGLIIIVVALLLWRNEGHAPRTIQDIEPTAHTAETP